MPFVCCCPACGHEERSLLVDFAVQCPNCNADWFGGLRTDPPLPLDQGAVKAVQEVLQRFIEALEQLTPEEAFTAAAVIQQTAVEKEEAAERRLRLAVMEILDARASGAVGDEP